MTFLGAFTSIVLLWWLIRLTRQTIQTTANNKEWARRNLMKTLFLNELKKKIK